MLTLKKSQLKAASLHSGVKDIRYYLNGVCLMVNGVDPVVVHLAATNGHTLFLGHADVVWTDEPQKGDWQIIIPADAIKTALAGNRKQSLITLSALPDGRYSLGDVIFSPIDGKFPDIDRVISNELSGEIGQYNPDLLKTCADSIAAWNNEKMCSEPLLHNGTGGAQYRTHGAVCVVMPHWTNEPACLISLPSSYSAK